MAITPVGAFTTSSTTITKAASTSAPVNTTVTADSANTFTPTRGETILVSATSGLYTAPPSTISGGGLTWTKQLTVGASGTCPIVLWTAEVTAATPAAVQIAVTYANSSTSTTTYGAFVVERYRGVKLPTTPNAGGTSTNDTTSPFSATITAPLGSYVSWMGSDYSGVRQTPAYLSNAVENGQYQNPSNGTLVTFSARQAVTAAGTQTLGWTSSSTTSKVVLAAIVLPPAPGFDTLVDTFDSGTLDTTKWTANGAGVSGTQAYVNCSQNAGAAVYSYLRSAVTTFYWPETALVFEIAKMIGAGTANAQFWIQDSLPAATVDRIGIEYTAAANTLTFRGQSGASYTAMGTDTTIAYDPNIHRWGRLTLSSGTVTWATSANGVTWTTQRTYAGAPNWTTRPSAQASFEASRTAGTNDTVLIDNVGSPRTVPLWNIVSLTTGVASWSADVSATPANCVAQGYQDLNYNRQSNAGDGDASGLAWPIVTAPAPFGRPGRATLVRVPDATKRYEMQPNVPDWADGEQYWIGMAFAFGDDYDFNASNFQTLWQSRPYDDRGSPPVAIDVYNGSIFLDGGYGRPTTATGDAPSPSAYMYSTTLIAAPRKRKWYNLVIFYGVWSAVNTGRVDVWIDGTKLVDNFAPPPGTNYPYQGSKTYPKCGIYHDPANRGGTVYIADHKVGTGYAGVDPTKTISPYGGAEVSAMLAA